MIALHRRQHLVTKLYSWKAGTPRHEIDEMAGQMRDILTPVCQRRHGERHHAKPVIQILAKTASPDFLSEIAA